MARRLEGFCVGYKPNDAALFEGCVCVNDGTVDGDADGNGLLGVVLPNNAAALDKGWSSFEGILDTGGYTSTPLYNLTIDKGAKVQKSGWAKAKGKGSTLFNQGEVVGYVPSDGGYIVPLRVNPQATPIGFCRQQITTIAAGDFVTVEMWPGLSGMLGERVLGRVIADSTAITGAAAGTATEAAFDSKVTIPANFLRIGSIVRVSSQERMTGLNGADTVIGAMRFGGLTGALLASTGATVAFASGDVISMHSEIEILSATTARLLYSQSILGVPAAAAKRTVGGANSGTITIPTITAAIDVVGTVTFSANSAGDIAVMESMAVTVIR